MGELIPLRPQEAPEESYLTVAEYCRILRVHNTTVYAAIRRGDLEHVRIGGTIRIPASAARPKRTPKWIGKPVGYKRVRFPD